MTDEERSSFVELDARKRCALAQLEVLRLQASILARSVKDIDREQDAWMVCFAVKNGVVDIGKLRFDVESGTATIEE
jgi:hypothetical protein